MQTSVAWEGEGESTWCLDVSVDDYRVNAEGEEQSFSGGLEILTTPRGARA